MVSSSANSLYAQALTKSGFVNSRQIHEHKDCKLEKSDCDYLSKTNNIWKNVVKMMKFNRSQRKLPHAIEYSPIHVAYTI
uniref:Uncharacterized protein n=1 Tax=Anguilla anguilla TaxID=7936 RepID=A0A0E9RZY0_ANGAN